MGSKKPEKVEELGRYVRAALLSARQHAPSLVPVLLVTSAEPTELGSWFEQLGGLVLFHHLSFLHLMPREADPAAPYHQSTAEHEAIFLRLDAHLAMEQIVGQRLLDMTNVSQHYALYTDTDVVFMGGGPAPPPHPGDISTCTVPLPQLLAIGAEMVQGEMHSSGVMVLNITQMHEELPAMVRLAHAAGWHFNLSVVDQGLILDYVKQDGKQATQLPDRLNFKAYWGGELGITIVHFHGPKPRRCTPCFLEHRATANWQTKCQCTECKCYPAYMHLLGLAVAADGGELYEAMSRNYEMYLQLAAMSPEVALSVLQAEQQPRAAGAGAAHLQLVPTAGTPQAAQLVSAAGGQRLLDGR
ncbi:glycosyl transferase family 8 [Micractinium conductrix]|uniref:Glycosyl transferase family 8 n=1 Tax=Micractinium conductrix TaxID=554055 RepID=A0A2P6VHY0_9CHLO|nr:glycosyl transferase family 8 [Micractinium conductrix]|eukprot:PSC73694.1 glycosyl transferase family 8 [Micractinium conductrix]